MRKRKYVHMQEYNERIQEMREAGMSRQEIADELGLEKTQIKNWISRYNRREKDVKQGIIKGTRGRPRSRALSKVEEYEREIARLEMENKLLRDFLRLLERK